MLNSLVYLYASALRPEQLEAEVLPLFEKHRIKHDVYTFQHLSRMFLNLRDMETVMNLWDRLRSGKEGTLKANQMLLQIVLEAALRLKNSDRIAQVLEEYVDQKKTPPRFLLQKLSHTKDLPDRIYVIMKENFAHHGLFLKKVREFAPATFREKNASVIIPGDKDGKRIRLKKTKKTTLKTKDRKALSQFN